MQRIDKLTLHNMKVLADYDLYKLCDDFQHLAALLARSDDFNEYEDSQKIEKYLRAVERGVKAIHGLMKLGEKYAE